MNESEQKKWVGGVCIKDGKVLLIHRINKERIFHQEYFVFPGKLVDEDESLETALTEEFKDISMMIRLGELLHSKDEHGDEPEYYYLCDHVLGEPSLPAIDRDSLETTRQFATPMWVSLSELDDLIVYPETVKWQLLEEKTSPQKQD